MAKGRQTSAVSSNAGTRPSELHVPVEEQVRLIETSRLFDKHPVNGHSSSDVEQLTFGDEIFNSLTLLIPFASLLVGMDILVHQQYGEHVTLSSELGTLTEVIPFLALMIFYTNRYLDSRWCQALLFLISVASGTRMVHTVNKLSYLTVMRQTPPLGTLWVYSIWQLNLTPAILSLAFTFSWVWWSGNKIVF